MRQISRKPLTLWFLNHEFDHDEVVFQVKEMQRQGFGGFFMHYLGGEPYLGGEWFRMLDVAIAEAKRCKMEAWLYDEAWCPSFFAGGRILCRRPELELRYIWRYSRTVRRGECVTLDFPLMKVFSAVAIPVKNGAVALRDAVDITPELGTVGAGLSVPFVNRTGYYPHVTPLLHWRSSALRQKCWRLKWRAPSTGDWRIYIFCEGRSFEFNGSNLLDTLNPESATEFINETHERYKSRYRRLFGSVIPGIMTDEPKFRAFPYTPALPELYEKRYSQDFFHLLPALIDPAIGEHKRALVNYHRLVSDMFQKNYIKSLGDWCRKNGLLLTGHMSPEECPWQEVELLGNLAGALRHFDIPGTDLIMQAIGDTKRKALNLGPRVAASVARQQGKNEVFVEVGACCRENLSLAQLKLFCDWLMVNGVNMITMHGLLYSLEGAAKFLTDQNLSVYNNLWANISVLNNYLEEQCRLLREYRPRAKVAVLKPLNSLRSLTFPMNTVLNHYGPKSEDIVDPDNIEAKCKTQRDAIDWSFINICWALSSAHIDYDLIDEDSAENWKISPGRIRFGKAVYSAIIVPACPALAPETKKGLKTFAANDGCVMFDTKIPESCAGNAFDKNAVFRQSGELIAGIGKSCIPEFEISGKQSADIMSCCAENRNGQKILFMLNIAGSARKVRVMWSGLEQEIDFAPFESRVVKLDKKEFALGAAAKPGRIVRVKPLDGWKIAAKNDNHLPITKKQIAILFKEKFSGLYLVCDESELEIIRNGLKINGLAFDKFVRRISKVKFYDSHNLRLDLRDIWKKGVNKISLDYGKEQLPTLLLAGRFSAFEAKSGNNYEIGPEMKHSDLVSRIKSGYPFLRGELEFSGAFILDNELESGALLELPGRKGSVSVEIDGKQIGVVAWHPDVLQLPGLKAGFRKIVLRVVGDSIGLLRGPSCEAGVRGMRIKVSDCGRPRRA